MDENRKKIGIVTRQGRLLDRLNEAAARAVLRTGLALSDGQGVKAWKSASFDWCLERAGPELLTRLEAAQTPGDFPLS